MLSGYPDTRSWYTYHKCPYLHLLMGRKIIHIDMDAFYASVEQRDNPELRGKPVAVGGSKQRGVVAAASYEARAFGVRSAMPSVTAARKCPDLIFVRPRFSAYKEVSQEIREIFYEYTDLVEPLSLDEAYLDVTENKIKLPSATLIAQQIRDKIKERTQLNASAGVSYCKFLAKIASDLNKPNGMAIILPEEAEAFIEQLPVKKIHGIGKVTAAKMERLGIKTGGDLKKWSELDLIRRFGKSGRWYYRIARGDDQRRVRPDRIRKSVGAERTFSEDLHEREDLQERLNFVVDEVVRRLQHIQTRGRTITLKLKSKDFELSTRSRTLDSFTSSEKLIRQVATELLDSPYPEKPLRLIGVSLSNLDTEKRTQGEQLSFAFE